MFKLLVLLPPHVVSVQPPTTHLSVRRWHLSKHQELQMLLSKTLWVSGLVVWSLSSSSCFVGFLLCFIISGVECVRRSCSNNDPVPQLSSWRKRRLRFLAVILITLTPDVAGDGGEHLIVCLAICLLLTVLQWQQTVSRAVTCVLHSWAAIGQNSHVIWAAIGQNSHVMSSQFPIVWGR